MMFELVIESFHSIDIFVHVAPELPNVQSNLSGNFFSHIATLLEYAWFFSLAILHEHWNWCFQARF